MLTFFELFKSTEMFQAIHSKAPQNFSTKLKPPFANYVYRFKHFNLPILKLLANSFKRTNVMLFGMLLSFTFEAKSIGCIPDESFSKSMKLPTAGKIKFREDYAYKINHGKIDPSGVKIGYERYDKLGQKLEEASYSSEGKSLLEITYTYDEWGREAQCLGLKENINFFNKWVYHFNEDTKTLEKAIYNRGASLEKTIYRFDSVGNIVDEISYSKTGELNYHYQISYTPFNKPAILIELAGNGEVYEKWTYTYNAQHQNIEVLQFNAASELYRKYINSFDTNGIQKEVLTTDKDGNALEKIVSIYQFY